MSIRITLDKVLAGHEMSLTALVVPRRATVRPGDRVHPRIDPARVVLFDQTPESKEVR